MPIDDILDCADASGLALGALRIGQRRIVLTPDAPGWSSVAAIAASLGGEVLTASDHPRSIWPTEQPIAPLHDWLQVRTAPGDSGDALGWYPGNARGTQQEGPSSCASPRRSKKILDWYEGDPPGVKANLARILSTGKLGGTGKVVILPVDQGFEHGPARSFAPNPPAYDPHYHYQLAIEAGLNAYAAPARHDRRRCRHLRRADPDHPESATAPIAWPPTRTRRSPPG